MKYFIYIVVSVMMQSFSYGYVSRTMDGSSSLLFVFIAFVACALFYFCIATKQGLRARQADVKQLALLNVWTAVAFVGFYCAISLTQASVASLVEAAVGPLWAVIFAHSVRDWTRRWRELAVASVVMACAVIAAQANMQAYSGADGLGFALAILAGGGAALVAISSQQAERSGIRPELILAHRFHGTYAVALALLIYRGGLPTGIEQLASHLLIACVGVVGPMYFLQLGMQRCEPLTTMLCLSVVPITTYAFELGLGGTFHWSTLLPLAFGVACSAVFLVHKSLSGRRMENSYSAQTE